MANEQEDLNGFTRYDAVGAAFLLGIVPAVMYWVFKEHDVLTVLMFASIAPVAAGAVLVLSFLFPERLVGRLVNFAGMLMAPAYLVIAVWLFYLKWCVEDGTMPQAATPAQVEDRPAGGAAQQP